MKYSKPEVLSVHEATRVVLHSLPKNVLTFIDAATSRMDATVNAYEADE